MATKNPDLSRIPKGATPAEVRQALGPAPEVRPPTGEAKKAFEAFGSAATDLQRINVEIWSPAAGRSVFWNAADVLGGSPPLELGEGVSVPRAWADAVTRAATRCLAAAEEALPVHRTRLYVTPAPKPGSFARNEIVLECRTCGALSAIPLKDVSPVTVACGRCKATAATAATVAAAAKELAALLQKPPAGLQAKLSIRTFDPPSP